MAALVQREGVNLDDTLSLTGAGNFIAADPPEHDRLRRVVRDRFTPATVAAMEPAIRTDVRATLAAAVRAGGFDGAATLAWAIPVRTISRLLGLPVDDEPTLRGWLQAVIRRAPDQDRLPPAARAAGDALRSYFDDHVARHRRAAGDDLLADIVAAEERGELAPTRSPAFASCSTSRGPRPLRTSSATRSPSWPGIPTSVPFSPPTQR